MQYEPKVYAIYDKLFKPRRTPCMDFLRELVKQRGRVNFWGVVRDAHVDLVEAQQWMSVLVGLGLVENGHGHRINPIGLGRFENQTCAQRKVNHDFKPRVLALIDQQLYRPQLDRIYFNLDDGFRRRADKTIHVVHSIRYQQLYISGLIAFAEHGALTRGEFYQMFRSDGDVDRVLRALFVQGLVSKRDGKLVANQERIQREIRLIMAVSARNNNVMHFDNMREIVAQQVFRGYVQKDVQKV